VIYRAQLSASLNHALDAAEHYLEREDLHGWDPYDALCSPLFRLPVLRSNHFIRFGAQQAVKRSRWNLRPTLRIEKQLNPVSIGLYLQGQSQRAVGNASAMESRRQRVEDAVERLAAMVSPDYSGSCWGYPFDWETRHGSIPANTPTIVATGMIANSLWTAHHRFGLRQAAELVLSAAKFVMHDLNRIQAADGSFCWAYWPNGQIAVFNATLKGSRLLAQAYELSGSEEFLDAAARSVRFVIEHQLPSGAWPYSLRDPRVDNFHTGYVLECLRAYQRHSGDHSADAAMRRGWSYYRDGLFTDDLTPKYYDHRVAPLDATACAQAIITLSDFGDLDAAARVAEHAITLLALSDGSFAYQRRRTRTVRTPFLRWSTAWMYCGLTKLAQDIQPSGGGRTYSEHLPVADREACIEVPNGAAPS
jgi:hypothetical protein